MPVFSSEFKTLAGIDRSPHVGIVPTLPAASTYAFSKTPLQPLIVQNPYFSSTNTVRIWQDETGSPKLWRASPVSTVDFQYPDIFTFKCSPEVAVTSSSLFTRSGIIRTIPWVTSNPFGSNVWYDVATTEGRRISLYPGFGSQSSHDIYWDSKSSDDSSLLTYTPAGINSTDKHPQNYNIVRSTGTFVGWHKPTGSDVTGFYTVKTGTPTPDYSAIYVGVRYITAEQLTFTDMDEITYRYNDHAIFIGKSSAQTDAPCMPALKWVMAANAVSTSGKGWSLFAYTADNKYFATYTNTAIDLLNQPDLSGTYTLTDSVVSSDKTLSRLTITCSVHGSDTRLRYDKNIRIFQGPVVL